MTAIVQRLTAIGKREHHGVVMDAPAHGHHPQVAHPIEQQQTDRPEEIVPGVELLTDVAVRVQGQHEHRQIAARDALRHEDHLVDCPNSRVREPLLPAPIPSVTSSE